MKDRRKSARLQTRLLNKQNEVLHKELEVSKFEFSEIINQYNQGKFEISLPYTLLNPNLNSRSCENPLGFKILNKKSETGQIHNKKSTV